MVDEDTAICGIGTRNKHISDYVTYKYLRLLRAYSNALYIILHIHQLSIDLVLRHALIKYNLTSQNIDNKTTKSLKQATNEIKSEIRSIEIPFDVFCNKILQTVIHATRMMIGLKPQCLHHEILLDTGEWLCRVVSTPATTINLHVR